MAHQILDMMSSHLQLDITLPLANAIVKYITAYESTGEAPLALHTPYLGIHRLYFLPRHQDEFLMMFNLDPKDLDGFCEQYTSGNKSFGVNIRDINKKSSEQLPKELDDVNIHKLKKMIGEVDTVNKDFKVVSNPFNIFITYLLHRVLISDLSPNIKDIVIFKILMFFQYKFFTSVVNSRFRYTPNEAVMQATYESLTNKFALKQYGTWYGVLESRAKQFMDNHKHLQTLILYKDDAAILYVISDLQTRVRNQLMLVIREFMATKENHDQIASYSYIGTNEDNEKILIDIESTYDIMIANVYQDSLAVTRFLDDRALQITAALFSQLNIAKLRSLIISFSELAVKQTRAGQQNLIRDINGTEILEGANVLIQHILQKSYRYVVNNKISLHQPALIIRAIRDVYGSSRILDPGILQVRESVAYMINNLSDSKRTETLSAFKIAFVLYIIILSFKYLN